MAYALQSHGWGMDQTELEKWYPGDAYVDWCAYSFFSRFDEVQMIDFTRRKGKPIFIARLQINEEVATKWKQKIYTNRYLHASDKLFDLLWRE